MEIYTANEKRRVAMKWLITIMRIALIEPVLFLAFLFAFIQFGDGQRPVPPPAGALLMLIFYGGIFLFWVSLAVLGVCGILYGILWYQEKRSSENETIGYSTTCLNVVVEKDPNSCSEHATTRRFALSLEHMFILVFGIIFGIAGLLTVIYGDDPNLPSDVRLFFELFFFVLVSCVLLAAAAPFLVWYGESHPTKH